MKKDIECVHNYFYQHDKRTQVLMNLMYRIWCCMPKNRLEEKIVSLEETLFYCKIMCNVYARLSILAFI